MNYFYGKKRCLKEILDAVTPEDEKTTFLGLEYVKNYTGIIIGPVHKDGYGNECDLFSVVSFNDDPEWSWGSFKEAKKVLEKNGYWKVFPLKKGIKIAFKHDMMLPDYYYEGPKAKWLVLYGDWFIKKPSLA